MAQIQFNSNNQRPKRDLKLKHQLNSKTQIQNQEP